MTHSTAYIVDKRTDPSQVIRSVVDRRNQKPKQLNLPNFIRVVGNSSKLPNRRSRLLDRREKNQAHS